ncbi:MAG TPA: alpha/beta fold hydrolase [Novosphingobium sp.]|nr:alpha/beta fold hydrolase [Novosphingobium sp.]HZV10436.1 alpha/beta fold hydrolase [Novosphingobium sp.]
MTILRAYTQCRYGQMHYREAGPALPAAEGEQAPRTLVMLHQNPSSSFEYEPLIACMAKDRRVIAFDTPGHGMSDAPPAPPGIAGYAAAFSDALDELQVSGPIDLYGFHTGSLLAIELALARPDLVGRLAVTGIPMYAPEKRAEKLAEAENFPPADEQGEVILGLLRNLWAYVVGGRAAGVPLDRAIRQFADKAYILDRFTWAYRGVWAYDYARLTRLSQPVLVLQPHEALLEQSRKAAKLMPHAQLRELPELDRDIFELAPDQLAEELRAFFD